LRIAPLAPASRVSPPPAPPPSGSAQWIGEQGPKVIFRDAGGHLGERFVYRADEPSLELVEMGRPWSFDGDGDLLCLVSEEYGINLAGLFDPYVAITTNIIEPLPHQISAVYEEMLPRQPMPYLLPDAPVAGKRSMSDLFVRELKVRGAPGRMNSPSSPSRIPSIPTASTASAVTILSCHQEKTDNMTRLKCH
jgi:hypothetical protein